MIQVHAARYSAPGGSPDPPPEPGGSRWVTVRKSRTTPKVPNPIQDVYGGILWGWTGKEARVGGRRHTYQIFHAYGQGVWVEA